MDFSFSKEQNERYIIWYKKHRRKCPIENSGAIGGKYSYIFTPTSLGVITIVKCACGEELDLTDVGEW
jgi:hypothetical protein